MQDHFVSTSSLTKKNISQRIQMVRMQL